MTPDDVMTPAHEDWEEFVTRVTDALAGPAASSLDGQARIRAAMRGCNSQHAGKEPFETSRAVLANMGFDVEASIAFFREHAQGCDCEVQLNLSACVETEDEDA
jgi:hypothetical protein